MEKLDVDVSIIIPVYNAEKYIRKCVSSVLSQQGIQFEVLLVDDGSTDQSGSICDAYEKKYENIHVFHKKNAGPAAARNLGLRNATGTYVQFLDADDELIPGYAEVFQKIACEESPDIILGGALTVNESKKLLRELIPMPQALTAVHQALEELSPLKKEIFLNYVWNKWYKRELVTQWNIGFSEEIRLGEDFLFNCAYFSKATTIVVANVPIYYYIKRDTQTLTTAFDRNELSRRRLVDRAFINLMDSLSLYKTQKDCFDTLLGVISYQSVLAITKKNCRIGFGEKRQYVREFAKSEYRHYLNKYRESFRCPIGTRVILRELCHGRCGIATVMILLQNVMKKVKKKIC